MASLIGNTLGKYRIVARLGRGGMAEVYKAYQPGLNRYVSVKVLHSHMLEDKNFVARFEREALAVGRLRHPNIVQAFDFDREGDIYFMAMEFIDGPTLKDELQARKEAGRPYSLKEIARIFTALCSAIDYAHARKMVHRDLKPANVMINQQGQVVLTDFGITRIIGGTQFTQTGALSGTPAYMSPEQGQGQHGDERSDIYSLGVMLYEAVTGVAPFDADTPFVVILKHISEPVPPPSRIVPDLPNSVEQIIFKAMSKDPADRFQRAGELAEALREATSLKLGEEYLPLTVLAPRPDIKEMDPSTGSFPVRQKLATAPIQPVGATISPQNPVTVVETPPIKKTALLPLLIGGGVLLLLVLAGIAVGVLLYSRGRQTPTPAAQIALSANATGTAEAAVNATATALFEANATGTIIAQATEAAAMTAPTQTAQAAIAAAEATAAQQTREAEIIAGVLSLQAATATAAAIEAATATAAVQQASATETAVAEATAQALGVEAEAATAATETAQAQAAQTAEAQTTATAQAEAAEAARAEALAVRGTFNDFETSSSWRRGDQPNGTFERSTAEAYEGNSAGKLDYQFSTPNNDFVVFLWAQPLGGRPNQITAWVNGDEAGHFLNIWVKDSVGETWQFSFGQIKHTGWQQMTAFLSPTQPWPAGHIDGPTNGVIDYPISFQALALDDGSDDFSGSGTIYIDDLTSGEGAPPPAAVPAQPQPQPASILFRADRTTLNAGGCAILSWSVDNISAVYLDGAPVTGQDSRQVCPSGTTTYTLHVVKKDGSSADVPVTITVQ